MEFSSLPFSPHCHTKTYINVSFWQWHSCVQWDVTTFTPHYPRSSLSPLSQSLSSSRIVFLFVVQSHAGSHIDCMLLITRDMFYQVTTPHYILWLPLSAHPLGFKGLGKHITIVLSQDFNKLWVPSLTVSQCQKSLLCKALRISLTRCIWTHGDRSSKHRSTWIYLCICIWLGISL